jgi:hypothetical protein
VGAVVLGSADVGAEGSPLDGVGVGSPLSDCSGTGFSSRVRRVSPPVAPPTSRLTDGALGLSSPDSSAASDRPAPSSTAVTVAIAIAKTSAAATASGRQRIGPADRVEAGVTAGSVESADDVDGEAGAEADTAADTGACDRANGRATATARSRSLVRRIECV